MLFEGEGRRERKRRQERQMKGEGEDITTLKAGVAQYYIEKVLYLHIFLK